VAHNFYSIDTHCTQVLQHLCIFILWNGSMMF